MAYNRKILEELLERIPKGQVTTHTLLGEFFDTTPRAVAQAVCRHKGEGNLKVVMKDGSFPHPNSEDDCLKRAKLLRFEGLNVSGDNRRVILKSDDIWKPKLYRDRDAHH